MLGKELNISFIILGAMVPFTSQASEKREIALYNHTADYTIDLGWNAYLTANYIYWHVSREDYSFYQSNNYNSGYQLGAGFNMHGMDNWDFYAEYTWYRNNRYHLTQEFSYDNVCSTLDRPFYFGSRLTANLALGLRGLWIDNTLGNYRQKSWALGPQFGFESNWLLGSGFKLLANLRKSALYTRYSSLSSDFLVGSYNTLRMVTDSYLGIGWSSYLGKKDQTHLDLNAGCDCNVYWNQHLTGNKTGQNIYIKGLNLGVRFDF
jgi:hypothetical protein